MDPFSMTVLLLIVFLAWSQEITWLFLGALVLFIITARHAGIITLTLLVIGFIYFFKLKEYWFIAAMIIMGVVLLVAGRKEKEAPEAYSPELMQLLAGQGGQGGY